MNTQLEKMLENSNLSEADRFDIVQIFEILPVEKQRNILNNLDKLIFRIEYLNKDIELQRKILLWDLFDSIKQFYKKYK